MTGPEPLATGPAIETIGPIGRGERITLLDILRGFAMFGVLLANWVGRPGTLFPRADAIATEGLDLFVWNSFYPLFSFLFGLGFAVQLLRAQDRGVAVIHRFVRRLLVLFMIGTVHTIVLWDGDILVHYAILGFLLIPLSWLPVRALLVVVVLFIGLQFVPATALLPSAGDASAARYQAADLARAAAGEERNILQGQRATADGESANYLDHARFRVFRWSEKVRSYFDWRREITSDIMLCFVIGLYVGRRRFLHDAAAHRRRLTVTLLIGLLLSIGAYAYDATGQNWGSLGGGLSWLGGNHALTAFYVSLIALLITRKARGARLLELLAPAGRMALTTYLTQSLVMTLLFEPYGLNIDAEGTVISIAVLTVFYFAVQVPLSHWWLARYRLGPVEWLWRSLTYGVRQPMRREA